MTLAELMAAGLSEEKAKAILAENEKAIADGISKATKDTEGLKKNRDALLEEKKKLQESLKAFEGLDPEKARAAQKKIDEIDKKNLRDAGEFDKILEAERAQHRAALEAEKTRADKAENFVKTKEVDRQLTEGLLKHNINDADILPAVKAMLKDKIEVVENNGEYNVLFDGKTLEQGLNEFAETPAAKKFVSAPLNTGGGAPGSKGGNAPPASVEAARKAALKDLKGNNINTVSTLDTASYLAKQGE